MTRLPDPISQSEFYTDTPIKRLFAWVIDVVITFVLTLVLAILTGGLLFLLFFGIWAIVSVVYRTLTLAKKSATPGMSFVGIEFRDSHGAHFDFGTAALHTLGTLFSFATTVQLISIILMLTTPRKQGLMDMLFGSVALNKMARR